MTVRSKSVPASGSKTMNVDAAINKTPTEPSPPPSRVSGPCSQVLPAPDKPPRDLGRVSARNSARFWVRGHYPPPTPSYPPPTPWRGLAMPAFRQRRARRKRGPATRVSARSDVWFSFRRTDFSDPHLRSGRHNLPSDANLPVTPIPRFNNLRWPYHARGTVV